MIDTKNLVELSEDVAGYLEGSEMDSTARELELKLRLLHHAAINPKIDLNIILDINVPKRYPDPDLHFEPSDVAHPDLVDVPEKMSYDLLKWYPGLPEEWRDQDVSIRQLEVGESDFITVINGVDQPQLWSDGWVFDHCENAPEYWKGGHSKAHELHERREKSRLVNQWLEFVDKIAMYTEREITLRTDSIGTGAVEFEVEGFEKPFMLEENRPMYMNSVKLYRDILRCAESAENIKAAELSDFIQNHPMTETGVDSDSIKNITDAVQAEARKFAKKNPGTLAELVLEMGNYLYKGEKLEQGMVIETDYPLALKVQFVMFFHPDTGADFIIRPITNQEEGPTVNKKMMEIASLASEITGRTIRYICRSHGCRHWAIEGLNVHYLIDDSIPDYYQMAQLIIKAKELE